ncbi:glycoside hydrolase family 16 [Stylonychia lemnae]|uniref:Glycoside hydrolase family 16 n=1 Tax=Stylonychia lemnae TaxID=5949 RepID=A0A078B1D0_STYLE|nr:glycoside hydrolase family 16 [Stylonychia lemnae]|eukprot:CDW87157.1 glycoside hydrolase family 16 [Stylonychia lemnae]
MYLQTQRLVGQQSLAEFMGLHLDLEQIFIKNLEKQGPGIFRKNGCIINTGDNMTKQSIAKMRKKNSKQFGLSQQFVQSLHLPKARVKEWLKVLTLEQILAAKSNFSTAEKIHYLQILQTALERKLKKIMKLQEMASTYRLSQIAIILKKVRSPSGLQYDYEDTIEVNNIRIIERDPLRFRNNLDDDRNKRKNGQLQQWKVSWSDEFDGDKINLNNWNFDSGNSGWGENQLQYYTDKFDNAYLDKGSLNLVALKENFGDAEYTSARLNSNKKQSFQNGKFEIKAKFPKGQGIKAGFLIRGDNIDQEGWPQCGEVELFKYSGNNPDLIYSSVQSNQFVRSIAHSLQNTSDGFHIISVVFNPDHFLFNYNDQTYFIVNKQQTFFKNQWPFQSQKYHLVLYLAVGGDMAGQPSDEIQWPAILEIDYIRLYKM